MMPRNDLRALRTVPTGQNRNEAMHLAVEPQISGDLAAHRFERATQVMHRKPRRGCNQFVGKQRRKFRDNHGSFRSFRQP